MKLTTLRVGGLIIGVLAAPILVGCSSDKAVAPSGPITAITPESSSPDSSQATLASSGSASSVPESTTDSEASLPDTSALGSEASTVSSTESSGAATAGAWVNATDGLVGLSSECGNMSLVSARPNIPGMIASVARQGLWADDAPPGTDTWTKLGTGPGSATITNRASSIVYDPLKPTTFWESGIYNGGGVYRTDDGGLTFTQLGDISHTEAVSIDFTDPARKTLLAGKHEDASLSRSTDGGATWTDIASTLPPDTGFSTGPLVIDSRTFVLGTNHGDAPGVFRSTDGGASWTRVFDEGVTALPLVTSDGAIYWVTQTSAAVIKSIDKGATWTVVTKDGTLAPQATSLIPLPGGAIASLGSTTIIVSADGGVTWEPLGPDLPFVPTGMTYSAWRTAFYVWHFDCDFSTDDPIQPNSIMRLDYVPADG